MTSLDRFKVVHHAADSACHECDHTGDVFAFWETHQAATADQSAAFAVCVECLFTVPGRFKNQSPGMLLRMFEEITSVNVYDTHVEIGTRSPFGYFFHAHYTATALCPVTGRLADDAPELEPCTRLTGESEIFREEDIAIADHSPYSELARRAVAKHDAESSPRNQ